ncbi:MAG: MBL fold metallo-hydrolase [Saprospiraceae bacterium]
MSFKQFGGKATKGLIQRYEKSPNWRDGKFQNLEETGMDIGISKIPGLLKDQLGNKEGKEPSRPIPISAFDKNGFLSAEEPSFIWYGHSVVLMQLNGQTILIDPMLGPNASPIAPITTKRFSENTLDLIDAFPEIELLMLTHDHYDHLDLASIEKLKHKTKKYFVALGTKRHFECWGINSDLITEFDWWDSNHHHEIEITYTPTRHFAGRGLTDRAKSLWGGWVFDTGKHKIWFSGDGGYGNHFSEVGKKFGGFDFAFMECGQYYKLWRQLHMFPEESVQAALDAGVKNAMPVHWAGFSLAPHPWVEPAENFSKAAEELNLPYTIPMPGTLFGLNSASREAWWKKYNG